MSTDKTQADVQPGGRVRLWDQAHVTMSEDDFANLVEGEAGEHGEMLEDGGPYSGWCFSCEELIAFSRGIINAWGMERHAQVAALSAQPSPGGQGDVPSIDYEDLLDQAKDLIHCGCSVNGAFEWLLEQLTDGEALAARQPVNESPMAKMAAALRGKAEAEQAAFDQRVQSCEWGPMPDARTQADFCQRCDGSGWDGESREIKCQSCAGAGIAARQPVGQEPVAWQIRRSDGSPLACWEACTQDAFDSTKRTGRYLGYENGPLCEVRALYVSPLAQAVDLGQFRQPVQDWLDDAQASMEEHGDYDGVFGYAIEEGTRLLALIDGHSEMRRG